MVKTKTGRYDWHRDWHGKMMADPAYQALPYDARGVYQTVRNLAGTTNNNGGLRVGSELMDEDRLVRWLVTAAPGSDSRRVRKLVRKLVVSRLLVEKRDKTLAVSEWRTEQMCAPTYEAEKKRAQRARGRSGTGDDDGWDGQGGPGGFAPRPPAPTSDPASTDPRGTCPPEDGDMSPRSKIGESEPKKKTESTRTPPAPNAGGRGAKPAAMPESGPAERLDVYDRTASAVDLACRLCGERGPWSRNGFLVLFHEVGDEVFRSALAEVQASRAEGVVARKSWGALLQYVAQRIAKERG